MATEGWLLSRVAWWANSSQAWGAGTGKGGRGGDGMEAGSQRLAGIPGRHCPTYLFEEGTAGCNQALEGCLLPRRCKLPSMEAL